MSSFTSNFTSAACTHLGNLLLLGSGSGEEIAEPKAVLEDMPYCLDVKQCMREAGSDYYDCSLLGNRQCWIAFMR